MGAPTATFRSGGRVVELSQHLVMLRVTKEVNRIPSAELSILDGSVAARRFAVSNGPAFAPGAAVEIDLRAGSGPTSRVFAGVVVRHGVTARDRDTLLTVTLKDPAVKLTAARRSAVFADQTDADAIAKVISDAGLAKGPIPATRATHERIVQHGATDWDFMVARADANGLLVLVENGKLSLAPMAAHGTRKHVFEFGIDPIYELDMEVDGGAQVESFESVAWDPANLAHTSPATAKPFPLSQGDTEGGDVAKKLGTGTYRLVASAPLPAAELQAWADGRLARNRMALLRGRVTVDGIGALQLLDGVEIAGIGSRFNGTTVVTGFAHRLSGADWLTDVQFGLPPGWFCAEPGFAEPPAAGLVPPVGGLRLGVVAPYQDDPEGEYRVPVEVPGLGTVDAPLWARLAAPDAGPERGWFFRPEAGDEVVVGFFGDDPRQPVVLGALHGSKHKHPDAFAAPGEDNLDKGIATRNGIVVHLTDGDKPKVLVSTPAGNSVTLDDDGETATLADQHGNTLVMGEAGIELRGAKDFVVDVDGAVRVKSGKAAEVVAGQDLKMEASGNVDIEGAKVAVK